MMKFKNSDDDFIFIKTYSISKEIREILNFSLDVCIANNIEFIWYRPAPWKIPHMRVIKDYCTSDFIFV